MSRGPAFDPQLTQLRAVAVSMFATLASFFTAWLIESLAHLHTNVVILAVALALTVGRVGQPAEHHTQSALERLGGLAVVAVAAGAVGTLMLEHVAVGDTIFALALASGIWLRRFGPLGRRAGTLLTLPFIAILVTPAPPGFGARQTLWTAAITLVAVSWVLISQYLGRQVGLLPTAARPVGYQPPRRPTATQDGARAPLPASTKMALQMGVGLGLAFVVGHQLFPQHWPWVVLTAYIVASGNRGRGDVVYKSGLRLVGAAVGTVGATLLANTFSPGDRWAVVAMFVVIGMASWFRTLSYAYWAAGVTAMLAFLYGYSGQSGDGLVATRLEAICCGVVVAVAAAWFVLPIKTTQIVRRRVADSLAALSDYLTAARRREVSNLEIQQHQFLGSLELVRQLRPTLRAHHIVARLVESTPHQLDAVTALEEFAPSVRAITAQALVDDGYLARSEVAVELRAVHEAATETRRRMGGRPLGPPSAAISITHLPASSDLLGALAMIGSVMSPA